jgi:drug/metabolite transporter (DMT)-like permease
MLSGSLAFAVMATIARALHTSCDWRLITVARTGLAFLFALALATVAGVRLVWGNRTLWVRSIAGSVSLVGTFYAYSRLPAPEVLTLTNLFPVWVALLSWPVLKEPPSAQVWFLVAVSMAGVALVQQPHLVEGNAASLVALVSSFFTAVAMLGLHRLGGVDPRAIVVHFSGVAFLFCVASLGLLQPDQQVQGHADAHTLGMLLAIGVTATVGQLFLTKAFAAGVPARVSLVGLSQVAFAMVLETAFLGASYQAVTLVGMVLVLAPSAWLMTREGP